MSKLSSVVILSGGGAGARDLTSAGGVDEVDEIASLLASSTFSSTASVVARDVRSLGGLPALLRMTVIERMASNHAIKKSEIYRFSNFEPCHRET
jgi:hypothetical protein